MLHDSQIWRGAEAWVNVFLGGLVLMVVELLVGSGSSVTSSMGRMVDDA